MIKSKRRYFACDPSLVSNITQVREKNEGEEEKTSSTPANISTVLAGTVSPRCIITGVATDSQQIEPIKHRLGP